MFSRDSRRRNKEAFLQKIGAHAKGDDERFLRKVQQHGDLEQRVYDAQRAVYDYSCAVHALAAAGCRVAAALEALGDTSDDAATHRELAAYVSRAADGRAAQDVRRGARVAAHRRDLARARDAEATRLAEETAAAAEAAGLEAAARRRRSPRRRPRRRQRRDSVKMPTGRAEAPPLPTGDRPAPRLPARPTPAEPPVEIVSALHAYARGRSGDLSFAAGDRITVVSKKADGWWIGFVDDPSAKGEFATRRAAPPP
ncbi:hypothetical protein JL720_9445 [Aureococcus anophagefferens]|nr:hypothetical protein JL720_9445 [Aureococcus anophagefferens]